MVSKLSLSKVVCIIFAYCAATVIVSHAQVLTTLTDFTGTNGTNPYASLVQGADAAFYGAAFSGGAHDNGTVFKITAAGVLTTLYNFCPATSCTDGSNPQAGLVLATDGNFYGTTRNGGTAFGTVFKITPSGALTTLYSFGFTTDGAYPQAALVQGADGNFYGTTSGGGPGGSGTVFKITSTGTLTTLYDFAFAVGASPQAALVQGADGNFYGTTFSGGAHNAGTVFKITSSGTLTTLYNFALTDGSSPAAALVQGSDGNFYGTTSSGGAHNLGTVFRITPGGTLTTLLSFDAADGESPYANLVQATDGNFYGTTVYGGANTSANCPTGCGTVFQITPAGTLTTLHSFNAADGVAPFAGLVQGADGNFYGTTLSDGASGNGTVFSLSTGLGVRLSVTKVGSGSVTSGDGNINCGAVCSSNYRTGSTVSLTATPALNWAFTSWSGCDSGQAPVCTVTMNNARNVTATFTPVYLLTVQATGNGTVTSADGYINCPGTCTHTYLSLSGVTLTATPVSNSAFTNWDGCDAVHGNICTVGMYRTRGVIATFQITYPVSVSTSGSGSVISGDGHINCGAACSYSYPNGTTLGLTAMPAVGSTLTWNNCNTTQGNVCTVVFGATNSVAVSAAFTPSPVAFDALTFNPSTAHFNHIAVGTLALAAPAPIGGVTIGVSSSPPGIVAVPSIIYIPGGVTTFRFGAKVIGLRPTTVTVTATDGITSTPPATLTVIP